MGGIVNSEISGLGSIGVIDSISGVNLNTGTKSNLYTVPAGKILLLTGLLSRQASANLTTAVFGFGFDANCTDVITAALHTGLIDSTVAILDVPKVGFKIGSAASVLGCKCAVAQGQAATITVDIIGLLLSA